MIANPQGIGISLKSLAKAKLLNSFASTSSPRNFIFEEKTFLLIKIQFISIIKWNSRNGTILRKTFCLKNKDRSKLAGILTKEDFKEYIDNKALAHSFADSAYIEDAKIKKFLKYLIELRQKESKPAGSKEFIVLEIGSFMGHSAKFFVSQLESLGLKPKIHCVDLMRGYYEVLSKMNYGVQAFHLIYNTEKEHLQNKVFLHAGKSTELLPIMKLNADLVYVDGEHTSAGVYADLALSLTQVADKGFILIDDVSWKANLDKKTVIYGIECFLHTYKKNIIKMYARGNKGNEWGFFEASITNIKELNTKHLLLVVERNESVTLDSIHKDVKDMGMYFSP